MSESTGKPGRKEILTEELALKIARMVSLFPDSQIPVTWENVMIHSKKKYGHAFNRQMLSQKEWHGRKLIAEAFSEAKHIQRRMHNDTAPKYKTAARSVLQKKIGELEAKNLALREELEMVRSQQVDKLDAFLNTTSKEIDLRKLLSAFYEAEK
ncbi:hypothetical protein EXW94_26050 [Enterobacter sp. JMULE2]|jgi:hypothetical protein|uniref:hypothetical protein n=1 Tax=Enterobacter sp. JMULE2 TaxID=2518340 RepID=UPI001576C96B|nr:hypothetical protein [Enterobacter sp. JMULE2]NTZ41065.1 hypothetical protein [Enterobacter sp. JMULE2]